MTITADIEDAILAVPARAWTQAYDPTFITITKSRENQGADLRVSLRKGYEICALAGRCYRRLCALGGDDFLPRPQCGSCTPAAEERDRTLGISRLTNLLASWRVSGTIRSPRLRTRSGSCSRGRRSWRCSGSWAWAWAYR